MVVNISLSKNLEGLLNVYGFQPTMIIEIDSMIL